MLLAVGISHLQRPATTSTAQKSCQQSWSASSCALWLSHACVPSRVGANLLLVAHVLVPRNITFVVLRNQFSFVATERATARLLLTLDTRDSSSYLAPVYGDVVTQVYRFDGIHKVNLGASYRLPLSEFQAIRFFARTENIFNQTYFESGFPTPGRTARGGIQFDF